MQFPWIDNADNRAEQSLRLTVNPTTQRKATDMTLIVTITCDGVTTSGSAHWSAGALTPAESMAEACWDIGLDALTGAMASAGYHAEVLAQLRHGEKVEVAE